MRVCLTAGVLTIVALSAPRVLAHPPSGIVADKQGQVYFVDRGRGVWKTDARGQRTLYHQCRFHWLALDEDGNFLKAAQEPFERLSPTGSRPVLLAASDYPITVARDGNLYYVAPYERPRLVRRTPAGKESVLAGGERGHADGRGRAAKFEEINDIASGPDGSLYVSQPNAVRKITPDGVASTVARDVVVPGCADDLPRGITRPCLRGLTVDGRGAVYVAATGCRCVIKVTPSGKVTTVLKAQRPWTPTGVAVAGGNVYVLEYDDPLAEGSAGLRIRKLAPDGSVSTLATLAKK